MTSEDVKSRFELYARRLPAICLLIFIILRRAMEHFGGAELFKSIHKHVRCPM